MALERITVPDFGDVQEITVLEVYVSVGDSVEEETPLVSLESEKAVMDIPSPTSGTITEIHLNEGDTVKSDDLIALLDTSNLTAETPAEVQPEEPPPAATDIAPDEPAGREEVSPHLPHKHSKSMA